MKKNRLKKNCLGCYTEVEERSTNELLSLLKEMKNEIRGRDEKLKEELRWRDNHFDE